MDPEIVQYTQNPIAKGYEMTSRINESTHPISPEEPAEAKASEQLTSMPWTKAFFFVKA